MNQQTPGARGPMALAIALITWLSYAPVAGAHGVTPPSLKGIPVPSTPGLVDGDDPIVIDKQSAIQLGKSLFWDVNVGSDGIACASCHFHAGADVRTRNQMAPGEFHGGADTAHTFEPTASGGAGGPNYELRAADFPTHQLSDINDRDSAVLYTTDDVISSAGVVAGKFDSAGPKGGSDDRCSEITDDIYHIGKLNTRRVEPRNTPTIINAAFNFRNFWDGRANNLFNGSSPFGPRDPKAGIWIAQGDGSVKKQKILLENSALASQAVAPAVNITEMSCVDRKYSDIARKLLARRPLQFQQVHQQDSVLADLRDSSGKGLGTTYEALIRKSFAPRYWAATARIGKAPGYTQIESNFPFFLGLALQLYQQTLISDDAPFDSPRDSKNVPTDLSPQQARGLTVFLNAHCSQCHRGPTLSAAAHPDVYSAPSDTGPLLVNRKTLRGSFTGVGVAFGIMDEGYANTGVTPTDHDPGQGANDPFGNPLSFSAQYLQVLLGQRAEMVDPISVKACAFDTPFYFDYPAKALIADPFGSDGCGARKIYAKTPSVQVIEAELTKPGQGKALVAIDGVFKIPSLRNVELTGPYMHNGSMKSLKEVVDFYSRGGNFDNPHQFATLVFPQALTAQQKADLVAFLYSLTDERVRWEREPFDHPEIKVPVGHAERASPKRPWAASDKFIVVPAVGRDGRTAAQGPLQAFDALLKP
ncbi:MAG: cytochrome c peroxidase [Methylotetracoccus sp.]